MAEPIDIVFDGHCVFCTRALHMLRRLDVAHVMRQYDSHDTEVIRTRFPMLAGADFENAMFTVVRGRVYRRYFQSERWGGYARSSAWVDAVQNPYVGPWLLAVWVASALCLVFGEFVVLAAGVNLLLCHYLFIRMRWRGVLRGMGAPGFIAF